MTYRVGLQWPNKKISEKTTTESRAVADYALCDLLIQYAGKKVAATMTRRSGTGRAENLGYYKLAAAVPRQCLVCSYDGPFIDDGETCPNCKLVQ